MTHLKIVPYVTLNCRAHVDKMWEGGVLSECCYGTDVEGNSCDVYWCSDPTFSGRDREESMNSEYKR
jgi:hypothetical protein